METTTHNNTEHHDQISWRAQRRIGIHQAGKYIPRPLPETVQSSSRAKTVIWNVDGSLPSAVPFRLLRILNGYKNPSIEQTDELGLGELFNLVNLRHLFIKARPPSLEFPPEFYLLWNFRTLIIEKFSRYENRPVLDIWRMPQLREVKVHDFHLTDPPAPMDEENGDRMVLENLETLKSVSNLRLGEEVVERIPNIKKLRIMFDKEMELELSSCLDNLCRLRKLEGLSISCSSSLSRQIEVTLFPISLRKLSLRGTRLGWEEMETKIGSLPYLEALKLSFDAFVGPEWVTAEGGFPSLKYLEIFWFSHLEQWRAEATHFPRLERLDLKILGSLNEIPLEIGDIPTLREIHLRHCNDSIVISDRKLQQQGPSLESQKWDI